MQLQVYTDATAFDTLRAEWNALLHASLADTLFQTWEWQTTWWRYLGVGDLRILAARDDAGHLVGLAPLFKTPMGRQLTLVGCVDVSDYLDLIVHRDYADAVYPLFVQALTDREEWVEWSLCNVPAASPTLERVPPLAQAAGWQVEDVHEDVCPVIPLPTDWEVYLATLNKHQRHEVRRKLRRLHDEAQFDYRVIRDGPDLDTAVAHFFHLHRLSHHDKARFMDERMETFFRAIITTLSQAGYLELALLYIEQQPAAAMLNFRYGDRLLVYNSGYDPAYRPHLSSGIVLLSLCIQDAIARGVRSFDFLQGDEEYKYRFGAVDTRLRRMTVKRV
ncbi:MAG: GNAT family N-acetyltransferase [Anaerolineae bacterium]|nr:GNAT family N-acetyltransferase [Anaerolineae bacterium]